MATIMQRIRDRIFNHTFIILQRTPEENSLEGASSLDDSASEENEASGTAKDIHEDTEIENLRIGSVNKGESNSSENTKIQQNVSQASYMMENSEARIATRESCTLLKISNTKKFDVNLASFYSDLKCGNSLETRCSGALNLALCLAHDSPDVELVDCLEALKDLCDSHNFPHLAVSHALLLCAFTKMSMSLDELGKLEESIVSLTESLKRKNLAKIPEMYKIGVLIDQHNEIVFQICQDLFCESLDVIQIDISTICCCSLCNLSSLVKQHDNELGANYNYKDSTLKYILGMMGKSTQGIISENMNSLSQKPSCPSMSSYRIKQCLQVLEHALSINPDLTYCQSFHHESFSLPHCLTRLLGWSVSSVFPESDFFEETDSNFKFHLSILVCILKILSILTFNPHQYDSFTNVKGLMEKILICTLKAYFESERNHFDIQILCLEMLINLYIKNQNTFILLCLKKFKISDSEEVFAVEALLKMLSDNLEKIKEVKESTPYPQSNNNNESNEDSIKKPRKETEDDVSKDDSPKKPRKETAEVASNEDPCKKPRKETVEDASNEDPPKKPRKEAVEDVSNEDPPKKPRKETAEDASNTTSKDKAGKETTAESDAVLLAASKDMEHSTIVSFICVLIVFFMRTKQNFKEFILERMTADALKEATVVSKKFLEFASLTGGMPVTGILILSQTITKLQAMQSS